jgi:HPt (histidine-containing phosphotransfer) domain-containing protein
MNKNNQLDLELLNGYLNSLGQEVLIKMLDLYTQQSSVYLQDIEQTLTENNAPLSQQAWQEHCHKLKGASGSVGLVKVHLMLVAMEKLTATISVKTESLQNLQQLNQLAIAEFKQWLAELN